MGPYELEIEFDAGLRQVVDFFDVLKGELHGPLKSQVVFDRVRLEHGNLVWPKGADFDPEILHDWPERKTAMIAAAVVDTKQCCG